MIIALCVRELVPHRLDLGPSRSQLNVDDWVLIRGMQLESSSEGLVLYSQGSTGAAATRLIPVQRDAEFVAVDACLSSDVPRNGGVVMIASLREGGMDLNRQYVVHGMLEAEPGDCIHDALPRLAGDENALLQLQLQSANESLQLSSLRLTTQRENERWRSIRILALPLGLTLLLAVFARYLRSTDELAPTFTGFEFAPVLATLSAAAGLLVLALILFGCCVNVAQKAAIYALLTGGRTVTAGALYDLLRVPFPVGGFPLFSFGHAALFAAAGFCLLPLRRHAWIDLLLLALATETLQIFVPGRGPGLRDVMIDWSGLLLAVVTWRLLLYVAGPCLRRTLGKP